MGLRMGLGYRTHIGLFQLYPLNILLSAISAACFIVSICITVFCRFWQNIMRCAVSNISGPSRSNFSSVGSVGGPGKTSAGAAASSAMGSIAGKMAGNIAQALRLAGDDNAEPWSGNSNDPYDIEELVGAMAKELKGGPSDVGELSRALHAFVQEGAAYFAARPESRSLGKLADLITAESGSTQDASLRSVASIIDGATLRLRETSS